MSAGKGDKPRPVDKEKFRSSHERIFNRCGYCGNEEYQVTMQFGKVCTDCLHEIENGR